MQEKKRGNLSLSSCKYLKYMLYDDAKDIIIQCANMITVLLSITSFTICLYSIAYTFSVNHIALLSLPASVVKLIVDMHSCIYF